MKKVSKKSSKKVKSNEVPHTFEGCEFLAVRKGSKPTGPALMYTGGWELVDALKPMPKGVKVYDFYFETPAHEHYLVFTGSLDEGVKFLNVKQPVNVATEPTSAPIIAEVPPARVAAPAKTKKPAVVKAPVDPSKLSGVGLGIYFAGLAGRPSKPAVIACFGKSGYALTWVARAAKLGITTEELCANFKANSLAVHEAWEAITTKEVKA